MGLSFTIAAGIRQRSHSRVRLPRHSSYFTVSDPRLPQPGRPGPRIYITQEQGGPVIPPGIGFPFLRLLRLAGLRWRYSTPPPHGVSLLCQLVTPVFKTIPRHGPCRKNSSSVVACVFVSAGTCLLIRFLDTGCITPFIKYLLPQQRALLPDHCPATGLHAKIFFFLIHKQSCANLSVL
jgi:hypothetical protein